MMGQISIDDWLILEEQKAQPPAAAPDPKERDPHPLGYVTQDPTEIGEVIPFVRALALPAGTQLWVRMYNEFYDGYELCEIESTHPTESMPRIVARGEDRFSIEAWEIDASEPFKTKLYRTKGEE